MGFAVFNVEEDTKADCVSESFGVFVLVALYPFSSCKLRPEPELIIFLFVLVWAAKIELVNVVYVVR